MLNFICIIIHIITLFVIIKVWRWKALVHPGFFFAAIWCVSVASEWYLLSMGNAILINQAFIDELNIYSAFTSLCFLIFTSIGNNLKSKDFSVDIIKNKQNLIYYLYLCIGLVILNFFIKGASLSFAANRYASTGGGMDHLFRQDSISDSIISIITSPITFFTICMGIEFARNLQHQSKFNFKTRVLLIPFIITFIDTLIIGGRNPIAICIKNYLLGLGLGLSVNLFNKRLRFKLTRNILLVIICFFIFTTLVAKERADMYGYVASSDMYSNKILAKFSGVMDYMSSHYWGYQLRRYDFSSGEDLKYGICTFYGLGDFSIPFSSIIGINGNLWALLDVDYYPLEVYLSGVEGYQTTSSIYSLLIRDYGVNGTYIAIIFLVLITQLIFINLLKKKHRTALSLIPIIIVFTYWTSSNFNSGMTSLQNLIIQALLFDITQHNYSKSNKYV